MMEIKDEYKDDLESIIEQVKEASDRTSSLYREAYIRNGEIKKKRNNEPPDPLNQSLREAAHLDEATQQRYITLAELYTENLQENIFRNQFELAKKYPTVTIDEWNDFLNDRIVSTYIAKHKRTLLKSAAEDNLVDPTARNKRDSLQLIKNIEAQEQSDSKKNICIIRIPDIYDEEE